MKTLKTILIIICFIQFPFFLYSQIKECGTIEKTEEEFEKTPWFGNNNYLIKFADSIGFFKQNPLYKGSLKYINEIPESNYKVPIQFWVYRDDNGNDNGMDDLFLQARIDELNALYLDNGTQIQFYRTCEIYYIDDDDLLYLDNSEQKQIIRENFSKKVINVHYVRDMTYAGVFWQLATKEGVIINQAWESFGTPSHEIGHYFNLEHTHRNSDSNKKCRQEAVSRTREFGWDCLTKTGIICEKMEMDFVIQKPTQI